MSQEGEWGRYKTATKIHRPRPPTRRDRKARTRYHRRTCHTSVIRAVESVPALRIHQACRMVHSRAQEWDRIASARRRPAPCLPEQRRSRKPPQPNAGTTKSPAGIQGFFFACRRSWSGLMAGLVSSEMAGSRSIEPYIHWARAAGREHETRIRCVVTVTNSISSASHGFAMSGKGAGRLPHVPPSRPHAFRSNDKQEGTQTLSVGLERFPARFARAFCISQHADTPARASPGPSAEGH